MSITRHFDQREKSRVLTLDSNYDQMRFLPLVEMTSYLNLSSF